MTPLDGKTILVTGAARGIGAAVARLAAARGARLALVGLDPGLLAALASELGPGHVAFPCDVTDQAALERAVAASATAMGGIDVVVANAGIANNGTVAVNPADALARTIEVNLVGVVRTVSAALPHVAARRGYFLLVSSAAALFAAPGMAAYAASKAGVEHFAAAFRREVMHRGIAVGVAYPGWIDTDLFRDVARDLPTFRATLPTLPGPFGVVTSAERCAEALVRAIARRSRAVHVPRSLAVFAALRTILGGALADRIVARQTRRTVPALEREVAALGRAFGRRSAALAGAAAPGGAAPATRAPAALPRPPAPERAPSPPDPRAPHPSP